MCGLTGFLLNGGIDSPQEASATARAMADAIAHRGPDDCAVWVDPALGVALAHRRLSIIDLSPEGRQPMHSPSGRYVLAFNGEIYNYTELRAELERAGAAPARWRGSSDTEVFLAACDAWGVEEAIGRANGMFAIALVDLKDRVLVLARDRMGEKPLYYGWQGRALLFASELKALRRHPEFENRVDRAALPLYTRFGYVPAPRSIYAGINKLLPGHMFTQPLDAPAHQGRTLAYWKTPKPCPATKMDPTEAVDELERLLAEAVRIRLHADVPLGAFLSGGVDSSTIVALMQEQATRTVRTYSIGFREAAFDESVHARAVAEVLETDHTEMHVSAADALAVVPQLPEIFDEPFADSSQIPTYLLSRLTRNHVTVALSGDGGDELFGGYVRYSQARFLTNTYGAIPRRLRAFGAELIRAMATPRWDSMLTAGPQGLAVSVSADRLQKFADVFGSTDSKAMYHCLMSQWQDPETILNGIPETRTRFDEADALIHEQGVTPWAMYVDQITYLPDDILVKVDRASMAVALETRVPFLDPNVVEHAARMPLALKIRSGGGKWPVRQLLYKRVSRRLVDRPKQGFGVPIAAWLRGPLREWAEDLLSVKSLAASGVFQPGAIRRAWQEHLAGSRNLHYRLWVVLMFQLWLRNARPALS